jgi:prolyl-tRNA synthetase
MRPRIFLRTAEFLWQEGHTAHATEKEAIEETLLMLEQYRSLVEESLAIPVILGEKSEGERFPGAVSTYTLEAMMQDRKALQGGTSHYLGQNFSKGFGIKFTNKEGAVEHAYTTSWGITTRTVGAMVMCHGDDDGLRVPPKVAPKQVVIIPVIPKPEFEEKVTAFCEELKKKLGALTFDGQPVRVHFDKRDTRAGEKSWEWIKKGVPLRIEVGPREVDEGALMLMRRDLAHKDKRKLTVDEIVKTLPEELQTYHDNLFQRAKAFRDSHIYKNIKTFEELKNFFTPKNEDKPEIHGGFVLAKWCGDPKTEEMLKELKVSIRCLPLEQSNTDGLCILTGKPATIDAIFAKSY